MSHLSNGDCNVSSKKFGLKKERRIKQILLGEGALFVSRSRGSFGAFDCEAYFKDYCLLVSVKSTKQDKNNYNAEITKLTNTQVPAYCKKQLRIWWSPNKNRDKKGWEIINI